MPVGLARHELAPKYVDVRPGSARAATPQGDGAFYLILLRLATQLGKPELTPPHRPAANDGYFRRAGRLITVGISTFGAASPNALNCSGLRNMAEHPEQA
jgi:hypothetical protein